MTETDSSELETEAPDEPIDGADEATSLPDDTADGDASAGDETPDAPEE